ncbi:MAG: DNA-binding domain-containing protein [Polyangiaceae bacterium]
MNRHIVDVDLVRERASATPDELGAKFRQETRDESSRSDAPDEASYQGVAAADSHLEGLRDEQTWFARAVMHPEEAPAAVSSGEANRVLTAGPRLGAMDRLEVYRRSYHSRLVECLADDYSVLQTALGESDFERLCRAYIARHPSGGPSLNFFGRKFESFCRDEAPEPFPLRDFVADLAALEWAIVEVIHAPSSEPLTLEGLRDVPIEAWASARLVPNSAFRLLSFANPVNGYFQAVRDGTAPPVPSPRPSATVVYRSGPTVWRMDLTVPMFEVLSGLVAGETLSAALSRAAASFGAIDEQEASQRVLTWFRDWVGSGLFGRVEVR